MGLYNDLKTISNNGKWWTPAEILPYNKPYNFIPGARGKGKSTGLAIYCILSYLYNHKGVVYVRRTKDELLNTCRNYFNNACTIINDKLKQNVSVEYKKGRYWITIDGEEKEFGRVVALSLQYKFKSDNMSDFSNIIYDEFIADPSQGQRYLGNSDYPDMECTAMEYLYGTVDRDVNKEHKNDTHVYFAGNATDYAKNPFFLKYGVYDELIRNPNAKIISPKKEPWLLQKARNITYNKRDDSWIHWIAGNNKSIFDDSGTDNEAFIVKTPDTAFTCLCNIVIRGKNYKLLQSEGFEIIRCESGKDPYSRTISVDLLGHDGKRDFEMVKAWHDLPQLAVLSDAFDHGRAQFDNVKTKNAFLTYLKYI